VISKRSSSWSFFIFTKSIYFSVILDISNKQRLGCIYSFHRI